MRLFAGVAAVVALLAGAAVSFPSAMAPAQTPSYSAPRFYDGNPDLNGIWQAVGTAHWDLEAHHARPGPPQFGALFATPGGLSYVDGGTIPYQPWAADQKRENFEQRWTRDPEAKCYMPGVPRATYMPFPFQIVQSTNKIMMVYEFASAQRTIHMDEVAESYPVDAWMGHSRGHWDGDTLVVEANSFHDQTWFDRAGNFHSNALRVVERYTPASPDRLDYVATIEDPNVFTRSWTIRLPLYRRMAEHVQLLEFKCIEFSEDLLYGHLRAEPARSPR